MRGKPTDSSIQFLGNLSIKSSSTCPCIQHRPICLLPRPLHPSHPWIFGSKTRRSVKQPTAQHRCDLHSAYPRPTNTPAYQGKMTQKLEVYTSGVAAMGFVMPLGGKSATVVADANNSRFRTITTLHLSSRATYRARHASAG